MRSRNPKRDGHPLGALFNDAQTPLPGSPVPAAHRDWALISVREGDLWRVQIAWPAINYFGRFGSELEARIWISTHRWMMEKVIDDSEIRGLQGSVRR